MRVNRLLLVIIAALACFAFPGNSTSTYAQGVEALA